MLCHTFRKGKVTFSLKSWITDQTSDPATKSISFDSPNTRGKKEKRINRKSLKLAAAMLTWYSPGKHNKVKKEKERKRKESFSWVGGRFGGTPERHALRGWQPTRQGEFSSVIVALVGRSDVFSSCCAVCCAGVCVWLSTKPWRLVIGFLAAVVALVSPIQCFTCNNSFTFIYCNGTQHIFIQSKFLFPLNPAHLPHRLILSFVRCHGISRWV